MSVEDETLSFRDLPLYGEEWEEDEDVSTEGSTSISSDDYFEFFTHQLFPPENIIFCGKIIPYKKLDPPSKQIHDQHPTSTNKNRMFSKKDNHQNTKKRKGSSSSAKARWHLFFTGISRFSAGMELRDIKTRQRQTRHCPPPSPAFRVQNYDEKMTRTTRSPSRLWEVVRVLSCGGNYQPNAMVVGSITCNRLH